MQSDASKEGGVETIVFWWFYFERSAKIAGIRKEKKFFSQHVK